MCMLSVVSPSLANCIALALSNTNFLLQSGDAWLDCAHFGGVDLHQLDSNIPSSIQAELPQAMISF